MLRTTDVLQATMPQDWFVTIDLKDSYFHIPIAPEHRQILQFTIGGSNISVQGSSVWPGFGSKSFFKVRPGSIGTTPEDRDESVTVPG